MGFLSKLFDPGKEDRDAATKKANEGIITGGSATGPGGLSLGFDFSGGKTSVNSSLGDFGPLLQQLIGGAGAGFGQAGQQNPLGDLTGSGSLAQGDNAAQLEGLKQLFQSSLGSAQADPFDLGAGISEKLRALSERRNTRNTQKTFDRLQASGNLGSSSGAAQAFELENQQNEQGLQFDLAGLSAGQGLQKDAVARLMGASGQSENILSRMFGQSMAGTQLDNQNQITGFDAFLRNQQQGTNIGLANLQGGMGLSQLPMALQNMLQGLGGQASNTLFASAGIDQTNAAMAKSPFLEALTAAGSLTSSIVGTGGIG